MDSLSKVSRKFTIPFLHRPRILLSHSSSTRAIFPFSSLTPFTTQSGCSTNDNAAEDTVLASLFATPSWAVRSLLQDISPAASSLSSASQGTLQHLLRLSALPLSPNNPADLRLQTLRSQLHFLRTIAFLPVEPSVLPLQAIRDETLAAKTESTITLASLRTYLQEHEKSGMGHNRRPRRIRNEKKIDNKVGEGGARSWDCLSFATRKEGRFFIIDAGNIRDSGE